MARGNQFGTFGGVFTPSILTILGVIMYLRLAWVVGHAGLLVALGIVLVAHVISVTTGLSISSIATDKRVGAGGPYYIVSRSLGLPIGGTLGLALFLGFSFSISFYAIGFSESFLRYFALGLDPATGAPTLNAIRLCSTAAVVGLVIITFISTALAIKTQYLILGLIVLSLVSIGFGEPGVAPVITGATTPEAPPLGVLFAVFFPAVTGFTAGVNMSGDLRDPSRSIPLGTMAAIAVGFVVYVALTIFLALRVPTAALVGNPEILLDIAFSRRAVVGGIWGATLSSALGSILSAPRILQALASDGIGPKALARGYGKTSEPRNALVLAFLIALAGIAVGDLNAIAGVVSMVFIATYGFLNLSCAIESWASPDFRPEFRIPKSVSVIGAVTAVIIMIQMDFVAMLGSMLAMSAAFVYLKRRQLTLDTGDAWEGFWSSLVRQGLERLSHTRTHARNWRPNVLLFSEPATPARSGIEALSAELVSGRGILTHVALCPPERENERNATSGDQADPEGSFLRQVTTDDPVSVILATAQHHGYPGLAPNTVVLDALLPRRHPERAAALIRDLAHQEMNVLLVRPDPSPREERPRVDIWWSPTRGNLTLSIALVRFLSTTPRWQDAWFRFLLVLDETVDSDAARLGVEQRLETARVKGTVETLVAGLQGRGFTDWVLHESPEATLVLMGLIEEDEDQGPTGRGELAPLLDALRGLMLMRPSPTFTDTVELGRSTRALAVLGTTPEAEAQLPALCLPTNPELAQPAARIDEQLLETLRGYHEEVEAPTEARRVALLESIRALTRRQLDHIARAAELPERSRRLRAASRVIGSLVFQCRRLLEEHEGALQGMTRGARDEALARLRRLLDALIQEAPDTIPMLRSREELAVVPGEDRDEARARARLRVHARLAAGPVEVRVPLRRLTRFHATIEVQRALDQQARAGWRASSHLLVGLSGAINALARGLTSALQSGDGGETCARLMVAERARVLATLDELIVAARAERDGRSVALMQAGRGITQALCDDLGRVDPGWWARRARRTRPRKLSQAWEAHINESEGQRETDRALLESARLALLILGAQAQVLTAARRVEDAFGPRFEAVVRRPYERLIDALSKAGGADDSLPDVEELQPVLDIHVIHEDLVEESRKAYGALPEESRVLSEESIAALLEGREDSLQVVTVPARRVIQVLAESEILAGTQEALSQAAVAERHALEVARDTVRLVDFQLTDLRAEEGLSQEAILDRIKPAVDDGIARCQTEHARLVAASEALPVVVEQRLKQFMQRSQTGQLGGTSSELDESVGARTGRRAVRGLRVMGAGASALVGDMMSALLYRRSAGVLAARALTRPSDEREHLVRRMADQVRASMPEPAVFEAVPTYYRQLFLGQTTINESFWIGRSRELALAQDAVARHRGGASGVLLLTGRPGAGKSALAGTITNRLVDPERACVVTPPGGGALEHSALRRALERATDRAGEPEAVLRALPEGSTLVFDDLELWFERRTGGLALLDEILQLVDDHGRQTLFVLVIGRDALDFLDRVRGLSARALSVIACEAVDARDLAAMILTRHRSTGRRFMLGARSERTFQRWRMARLFNRYFDRAGGNPGAAMAAWLAHIEQVDGKRLGMRWPSHDAPALPIQSLRPEWLAVLMEFVLHKELTWERLGRVTGLAERELRERAGVLLRMGLLVESKEGVLTQNRFVDAQVLDALDDMEVLP